MGDLEQVIAVGQIGLRIVAFEKPQPVLDLASARDFVGDRDVVADAACERMIFWRPHPRAADVLVADHAEQLALGADRGIEQRMDVVAAQIGAERFVRCEDDRIVVDIGDIDDPHFIQLDAVFGIERQRFFESGRVMRTDAADIRMDAAQLQIRGVDQPHVHAVDFKRVRGDFADLRERGVESTVLAPHPPTQCDQGMVVAARALWSNCMGFSALAIIAPCPSRKTCGRRIRP